MFDLISIEEACGILASGISKILLILPEDVVSESIPRCLAMTDMPALLEGKAMYPIAFDRKTARYVEKKDISNRAGDYYNITLTFTCKKSRIELDMLSMLLLNRRVHALIIFKDKRTKYVKNLRCEDESDSGDQTNRSEHRFRFTTKSLRKSASVGGVLPPEISGIVPSPNPNCAMIGISPNGQKWCITIDNYGDLVATKIL